MTRNECIERIEKYLLSSDTLPRIIDFHNVEDLNAFKEHFYVSNNEFINIESYSKLDECPSIDKLFNLLSSKSGNIFLTGLSTALMLQGESELSHYLGQFLQLTSLNCKTVVLCYQSQKYLRLNDVRASRILYSVDGHETVKPSLKFFPPQMPIHEVAFIIEGIHKVPSVIESTDAKEICVITNKRKSSFPHSLFTINEVTSSYDVLCELDPTTERVHRSLGTEEQWNTALACIKENKTWQMHLQKNFGGHANLHLALSAWDNFDSISRWMFFIALKLNGASSNWCLKYAAEHAKAENDIVRQVYRSLLSVDSGDSDYWNKYDTWKALLNSFGHKEDDVLDYCAMVRSKGESALYYLTDNTRIEREMIFETLDKYGVAIERNNLLEILKRVYPDLYSYMMPYRFNNEILDVYFQAYKYQKVVNKVFPEFEAIVEEQAIKRDFYHILPPRTSSMDSVDKSGSHLYFMDAMGVEYLGFIMDKCRSLGLMANVMVCRCELPSLTFCNKEFLQAFKDADAFIVAGDKGIKKLDDIKHHGEENFDYQLTKLPLHLGRELDIINDILKSIQSKLLNGAFDKAVMVADHGATRLAVIKENTLNIDVNSKGSHGGRVCEYNDSVAQIPYATRVEDYYILANYDRFKGGRAASVETHGGATLEEVTVPIIEITTASGNYEIAILTPEIKFSTMKKNAKIEIFSKTRINNISVEISGVFYDAEPIDSNNFVVRMPDLRKVGVYNVSIYSNNNKIKDGLSFKAEKEGFVDKGLL